MAATVSYCDDESDVASITGESSGDAAIICDKSTDVFTIQRYIAAWAQVDIGGGVQPGGLDYADYRHSTAAGVAGGGSTAGSWQDYPLSDEDTDTITISFDDANDELDTVPAGEYEIFGFVTFRKVSQKARIRLYDSTAAAAIDTVNSSSFYGGTRESNAFCYITGRFKLYEASTIKIQYWVLTSDATDGLGLADSLGSLEECFGRFELRQIEAY